MKQSGGKPFYCTRFDAWHFYGKQYFDSFPKKKKERLTREIEKIYRKSDETIAAHRTLSQRDRRETH